MKKEKISKVIGELADRHIEDALYCEKKIFFEGWGRWKKAAACAALAAVCILGMAGIAFASNVKFREIVVTFISSFSEKEKEFLISQWDNLKTPFYYEYAEGWKALLDSQYLPTLLTLLAVILGALVAGIFSDEYSWKADSIFFSSKLGRNKAGILKKRAGFFFI